MVVRPSVHVEKGDRIDIYHNGECSQDTSHVADDPVDLGAMSSRVKGSKEGVIVRVLVNKYLSDDESTDEENKSPPEKKEERSGCV